MKVGRNFTNLLETSFLTAEEKKMLKEGKLSTSDMDAEVQIKSKRDIKRQIEVVKKIGLAHIELDGGAPNPFLSMSDEEVLDAKNFAREMGVSISVHLPYTFVAESIATFQEEDRLVAVDLLKRYIDFAVRIGACAVNIHPGSIPFYQATGKYLDLVKESLVKSISELVRYTHTKDKGIVFHTENNTAFDFIGVEVDEVLEILKKVRALGLDVKFCFDIGHWLTRALPQFGKTIPEKPEEIVKEIPDEFFYEVHLNDFFIEGNKFEFHPPLNREKGFLKRENLINLREIFKSKGVEIIVVETAVRDVSDLLNSEKILEEESRYLSEIFGG